MVSKIIVGKREREIRKAAEDEGLTVIGVRIRNRHRFMTVRNAKGLEWECPFNPASSFIRDLLNTRANFRRFARGETAGLIRQRQSA